MTRWLTVWIPVALLFQFASFLPDSGWAFVAGLVVAIGAALFTMERVRWPWEVARAVGLLFAAAAAGWLVVLGFLERQSLNVRPRYLFEDAKWEPLFGAAASVYAWFFAAALLLGVAVAVARWKFAWARSIVIAAVFAAEWMIAREGPGALFIWNEIGAGRVLAFVGRYVGIAIVTLTLALLIPLRPQPSGSPR